MFLRIEKEKINVAEGVLNQEAIMIKLENTLKELPFTLVQLKAYNESDITLQSPFFLPGIPNEYGSDKEDLSNYVVSAKFVLKLLKERFELTDNDVRIVIENVWTEPERGKRVYIPYKNIIDNYSSLINTIKFVGAPYHEVDTGYVVYLEEILPSDFEVLNSDSNVIIEEQ